MPDLRFDTVTAWLDAVRPMQFSDPWPPPVRPVEASDQATRLLVEFGQILDDLANGCAGALSAAFADQAFQEELRLVLAQVGAARTLSFFHWLRESGLPDHLAIESALLDRTTPSGRAIFVALTTVARQATLHRLISIERMDELLAATEDANQEPAHV